MRLPHASASSQETGHGTNPLHLHTHQGGRTRMPVIRTRHDHGRRGETAPAPVPATPSQRSTASPALTLTGPTPKASTSGNARPWSWPKNEANSDSCPQISTGLYAARTRASACRAGSVSAISSPGSTTSEPTRRNLSAPRLAGDAGIRWLPPAEHRAARRKPCCPSTSVARLPSRRAVAPAPCL